jgi:hypothetical protein
MQASGEQQSRLDPQLVYCAPHAALASSAVDWHTPSAHVPLSQQSPSVEHDDPAALQALQ